MKRIVIALFLLLPGVSNAQLFSRENWQGHLAFPSIPVPTYTRDYWNGQDLAGIKTPVWRLYHKDHEALNVGVLNAWNVADGVYSVLGLSIGTPTGQFGPYLNEILKNAVPDYYKRLQWMTTIADAISFDTSIGYRFLGHTQDVSPLILGIGCEMRIPFSL